MALVDDGASGGSAAVKGAESIALGTLVPQSRFLGPDRPQLALGFSHSRWQWTVGNQTPHSSSTLAITVTTKITAMAMPIHAHTLMTSPSPSDGRRGRAS